MPTHEVYVMALALFAGTVFALLMIERNRRSEMAKQAPEQLDLYEAIEARDAILDQVASDNSGWMALAAEALAKLPEGLEATGEGFRVKLLEAGLREPRSPQVWGSFFRAMANRGVLVRTGEYRPMTAKKAHARETRVYRKVT